MMNIDAVRELLAKAEHDDRTHEQASLSIEVTHTTDCGTLVDSAHHSAQIAPHYYTSKPALGLITAVHCLEIDRVDELIALLQRARQIMAGEGS
jgi:hypothetical protein